MKSAHAASPGKTYYVLKLTIHKPTKFQSNVQAQVNRISLNAKMVIYCEQVKPRLQKVPEKTWPEEKSRNAHKMGCMYIPQINSSKLPWNADNSDSPTDLESTPIFRPTRMSLCVCVLPFGFACVSETAACRNDGENTWAPLGGIGSTMFHSTWLQWLYRWGFSQEVQDTVRYGMSKRILVNLKM